MGKCWAFLPHGVKTNMGAKAYDGLKLSKKLSLWEGMGPLLAVVTAPEKFRGKQAVCYIDNDGSVSWFQKGWAKGCNLGNTVLRATYLVANFLNCEMWRK